MSEFGSTRFWTTWTVDPVRNRRNDRYLSFGDVDEMVRTLTTTKHPASVISLGFVASNGRPLTAADYIEIPWVWENFPGGNVVLQQDGAPAHKGHAGLRRQPLGLRLWPHIESKACKLRHPNIDALKAAVNQEWAGMYEYFV
ncbi:Uncharacterized protein FKW44_006602, partial [Caligus rogercresseyi]